MQTARWMSLNEETVWQDSVPQGPMLQFPAWKWKWK